MTVQTVLFAAIDEPLKRLGFRRRGSNWYHLNDDLYSMVNLQRSRWDESFYVNFGFAPIDRLPDENIWLPESKCLVRFRLDALNSVSADDLQLLDEDVAGRMVEAEFREVLSDKIARLIMQIMETASNVEELSEVLASKVSGRVFVHRDMVARLAGG